MATNLIIWYSIDRLHSTYSEYSTEYVKKCDMGKKAGKKKNWRVTAFCEMDMVKELATKDELLL